MLDGIELKGKVRRGLLQKCGPQQIGIRVHRSSVQYHLVMQMRRGDLTRRSRKAERLTAANLLPWHYFETRQMRIPGGGPVAVIDDDHFAVASIVLGVIDDAVGRRMDR